MNLNQLFACVAGVALLTSQGCKKPDFVTNANGLQYKIFSNGKSTEKPKKDDIVEMHYRYTTLKDSLLYESTSEQAEPIVSQMPDPPYKGCFQEGLMMMSPGDSAVLISSADSFFTSLGQTLPPYFKKGDKLKMHVKIFTIQSLESYKAKLPIKETTDRAAYIKKNNIQTPPDADGMITIVHTEGTGMIPAAGDTAVVNYTGKFLNGKTFDSSEGRTPISFAVGTGRVIPAWDKALMKMKKGSVVTIIIPSELAYGPGGSGPIPPYSTLVFDINLVDVIKGVPPVANALEKK